MERDYWIFEGAQKVVGLAAEIGDGLRCLAERKREGVRRLCSPVASVAEKARCWTVLRRGCRQFLCCIRLLVCNVLQWIRVLFKTQFKIRFSKGNGCLLEGVACHVFPKSAGNAYRYENDESNGVYFD